MLEEHKPKPKPEASIPPPRPPRGPGVAKHFGDDEGPDKETVRIELPPKASAAITIKVPQTNTCTGFLKRQVTKPEADRLLLFACAAVGLFIAAIPPYGIRAFVFGMLAAVNGFNGWRLHRRIRTGRVPSERYAGTATRRC